MPAEVELGGVMVIGPASTPIVIAGNVPKVGDPAKTVSVVVELFASKLPDAS